MIVTDIIAIVSVLLFSLLIIRVHYKIAEPIYKYTADAVALGALLGIIYYINASSDTLLPKGILLVLVITVAAFDVWIIQKNGQKTDKTNENQEDKK